MAGKRDHDQNPPEFGDGVYLHLEDVDKAVEETSKTSAQCDPRNVQAARAELTTALDVQEGGSHYKNMAIQPVEFTTANRLSFLEGSVVKRVCRHRTKNGAEDIRKAIHELQLLLQLEYGEVK